MYSGGSVRRLAILFAALGSLAACSLSGVVDQDVLDYFRVNDLATNRIILLNVLRAKDRAPLHFSELSQVRGQVSVSLTAAATMPIGPLAHTTSPRGSSNDSANVSTAPSFDIVSLDTKDFTTGVMAPITPATMKFFLDEGVNFRLVLMLLTSGMRPAGEQELILNEPESARNVCYPEQNLPFNARPSSYQILDPSEPCSGHSEPEFYGFLRLLNNMRRVYAINYRSAHPVGPPFSPSMDAQSLRSVAAVDPAKYQLKPVANGKLQLVTVAKEESVVLCEEPSPGKQPLPIALVTASSTEDLEVPEDACVPRSSAGSDGDTSSSAGKITLGVTPGTYVISLRSTLEVIEFLGRILDFQETASTSSGDRCVTLSAMQPGEATCGGEVLFRLRHTATDYDIGLDYNGQYWAVPPAGVCKEGGSCDHTLETMSMVALLLNQNKSAKDIPTTPAAEIVP